MCNLLSEFEIIIYLPFSFECALFKAPGFYPVCYFGMVSWFRKPSLEDQLFDLKFTSRQLLNFCKRCEKEEKQAKAQLKKAIQAGNMDSSRIYAENAIRKKNEALNYMRMSSRIDAVAARVQTAVTTRSVTDSMSNVVKGMAAAMKSMNLERVSNLMDMFEKEFENLDVQSQVCLFLHQEISFLGHGRYHE